MSEHDFLPPEASRASQPEQTSVSQTVRELIKLSDWILLASVGRTEIRPEVLARISRQLTEILALEGVIPLEQTGPCDYEHQMVVGTQTTNDPSLNDHVYATVRPGYLFHHQVLRPQEVIVYASEPDHPGSAGTYLRQVK